MIDAWEKVEEQLFWGEEESFEGCFGDSVSAYRATDRSIQEAGTYSCAGENQSLAGDSAVMMLRLTRTERLVTRYQLLPQTEAAWQSLRWEKRNSLAVETQAEPTKVSLDMSPQEASQLFA